MVTSISPKEGVCGVGVMCGGCGLHADKWVGPTCGRVKLQTLTFSEWVYIISLTVWIQSIHFIVAMAAVRTGDLVQFGHMLDQCGERFQKERTYTLIVRLRHNVIKTGIRMISLSYSRWVWLMHQVGVVQVMWVWLNDCWCTGYPDGCGSTI